MTGTLDGYVAKFDNTGNMTWSSQFGGAGEETWANGVALDTSGNIYAVGSTKSGVGGTPVIGSADAYVVKLSAAGVVQ